MVDEQARVTRAYEAALQSRPYDSATSVGDTYARLLRKTGAADPGFVRRAEELREKQRSAFVLKRSLILGSAGIGVVILAEKPHVNSIGMKLKLLLAGTYMMGSAKGANDEKPHKVTLTRPFYLGVHEVTQEQYQRVMGKNPSEFKGPQNPVEKVSWEEAVEFCRKLSALPEEKAVGRVYRLPTEAEWKYACRAGSTTEYSFGDSEAQLSEYAWYARNSGSQTHPVGQKKPNAWGLYDMHGNVWEWCQDWYGDYPSASVTDPAWPSTASNRVNRGGSWLSTPANCRSANRNRNDPSNRNNNLGFRVALSSASNGGCLLDRTGCFPVLYRSPYETGADKMIPRPRGAGSRLDDRVERSTRPFSFHLINHRLPTEAD